MSGFVPLCMTKEELDAWRKANASPVLGGYRASRPCVDCPTWFRDEMLAERKCNGQQRMQAGAKHSPLRLLQWREAQRRKREGVRIRRTPEQVAALAVEVRRRREAGEPYSAIGRDLGISWSYARDLVVDAA